MHLHAYKWNADIAIGLYCLSLCVCVCDGLCRWCANVLTSCHWLLSSFVLLMLPGSRCSDFLRIIGRASHGLRSEPARFQLEADVRFNPRSWRGSTAAGPKPCRDRRLHLRWWRRRQRESFRSFTRSELDVLWSTSWRRFLVCVVTYSRYYFQRFSVTVSLSACCCWVLWTLFWILGCIECKRCSLLLPMGAASLRPSVGLSVAWLNSASLCGGWVIWCSLCRITSASCYCNQHHAAMLNEPFAFEVRVAGKCGVVYVTPV